MACGGGQSRWEEVRGDERGREEGEEKYEGGERGEAEER